MQASHANAPVTLDSSLYARERKAIFARSWLFVGHESQLAEPGAVLAATIAGFPVLVVRDENALKAYHNVFRHRAGPLAPDGESVCAGRLTCRYHGWSYMLDGRLASARDFGPARDFDPRDYSLFPLRCESWKGLVFVNADPESQSFRAQNAELARSIESLDGSLRVVHRASHPIRCNWKTYVENYLEGYHVPLIHPALDASGDFRTYDVGLAGNGVLHRVAAKSDAAIAGIWVWLWPCLAINLYADGVLLERMNPLGHDAMTLDYLFLAPPHTSEKDVQRSLDASLITTREDIAICEAVQRNLDAGIYREGRLSPKHEQGVAWFQSEVRRALGNTSGENG